MKEESIESITRRMGLVPFRPGHVINGVLAVRFREGIVGNFYNNGLDVANFLMKEIIHGGIESITPADHVIKGKGIEEHQNVSRRLDVKMGGKLLPWVPKTTSKEDLRLLRQKLIKEVGFAEDIRG